MKKFALDTNILLRYIAQDDKKQSKIANKIIENLDSKNPAFISLIVLCEINWVLKSAYKINKKERIKILENIIYANVFEIENSKIIYKSLTGYEGGKADFSDYVIGEICKLNQCEKIITFDKNAAVLDNFISAEDV